MDYPPFDFAIEGEPHGYSIDLLNLLKKRIGIQIEYINGYTWHELVEMFKDRKIDLLHTLAKTPERNKFAIFSDRFFRDRQVYITRKENPEIKDISQLYGKTISQAKGWSTTEYFQANFPQISLLIVNSLEEMFDAVAYGDAYATVVDESAAAYTMKKLGMRDLKIAGWFKEIDKGKGMNFYFAAQKDAHELISLLNKALASIPPKERNAIKRRWISVTYEHKTDYSLIWKVVLGALVLVGLILYWNNRLKQEVKERKQAEKEAAAANRAQSDFLANMSHELRTPLNIILGFSELLTRSPNLSSEQRASLQTIGRSGEHLLALINDVLEFSKIEAGKIELNSELLDLHGFLLGLEEMFRLSAGQKGLALKFILNDNVPAHIRVDKNKLRQVLINLLGNAVKFTGAGSVTLHGQCRMQKPEPSGRCLLRFTVADTGAGISPRP
jgi:ABC-type amino acid transport substrate-binding protein